MTYMKYIAGMGIASLMMACTPKAENSTNTTTEDSTFVSIETLADAKVTSLAFGSCSRQELPQVLWPDLIRESPQAFIWLGDNVYGDTDDMEVLAETYAAQKSDSAYQVLRAQVPIVGTWDDHDYGRNDAGIGYPYKKQSQQLALDFLDVPAEAPVRSREGMYQHFDVGAEGERICIILLDTRYHRDTLYRAEDRSYLPNADGDVLGEAQWSWLEQVLRESTAQVHLIGSSIQLISEEHPYEKWANFPQARQRLFQLISDTEVSNPIVLSGDRHISELSLVTLDSGTPLYDFTSSGLTHTWREPEYEPNQHRVGEMIYELNYGLLGFDWEAREITLEIKGVEGARYLQHVIGMR